MEMSVILPPKPNSWEIVAHAEQLGYSRAYFYDTALLTADLFACMAVAATKTSKIKLFSGVMIPSYRIAPVAANGLATLNALAPGRIGFGVGTGFTGRRTMGLKQVTQARLSKYVEVVQDLLAGKMVEWDEDGRSRKIQFIDPELSMINLDDPIPLAISAFGPKGRALVVKHGANWITAGGHAERVKPEIEDTRAHWAESGRDPEDFYPICSIGGCVLDDGESPDSKKALAQAGPFASVMFHAAVEAAEFGALLPSGFPFPEQLEQYRKVYEQYEPADARYLANHRGHTMYLRPEETHLTGDIIKVLTMTGTKKELAEQLKEMKALGFKEAKFHTAAGHEHEMIERWADVMAEVNA